MESPVTAARRKRTGMGKCPSCISSVMIGDKLVP